MGIDEAKRALRRRMRAWRDGLAPDERDALSREITARVLALEAYRKARVVLLFVGIGPEVATGSLLRSVRADGKRLVLPRIGDGDLVLHAVDDPEGGLVPGVWDIPEPAPDRPEVAPEAVDLFLLPGLAFDPEGGRLGYGRGYFDRVLARAPGHKVGLAFDGQVVEAVPQGPSDVRVDQVVTPTRVIQCGGAARSREHGNDQGA